MIAHAPSTATSIIQNIRNLIDVRTRTLLGFSLTLCLMLKKTVYELNIASRSDITSFDVRGMTYQLTI